VLKRQPKYKIVAPGKQSVFRHTFKDALYVAMDLGGAPARVVIYTWDSGVQQYIVR